MELEELNCQLLKLTKERNQKELELERLRTAILELERKIQRAGSTTLQAVAIQEPLRRYGMMPPPANGRQSHLLSLWNTNHNINLINQTVLAPHEPVLEEDTEEDEALGIAETYADYNPAKLKIGKPHPDPVVETASLASVQPPDVYYKLHLPDECVNKGWISALQLEAVVYACQQHGHFLKSGERAGYLIGDGAGVGKGRTIAGIIFENYLCGRKKSLWVSVSADLKEDCERDLRDIGAQFLKVTAINNLKYGKIHGTDVKHGVLFATYSGLIGKSSSGGPYNSRYKQIVEWLGKDFDGCIVFDECHRAKNLCPVNNTKATKTALTVQLIQNKLKRARVVYASSTGASEPQNMAYMTRLNIWGPGTPFKEFTDFLSAVQKRGIAGMEIVAMDMKLRGAYIARQLSFKGVAFTMQEVPLTESFSKMYNEAVDVWVEALQKFTEAADLMKADISVRKSMWPQFWSSHQRFFKYLCIAAKVEKAVAIARKAVKDHKCVVIGLQSTGEAKTTEQKKKEGELDDFVSTAKGVLESLVENHFPAPDRRKVQKPFGDMGGVSMIDDLFDSWKPQAGTSSSSVKKPTHKTTKHSPKRGRWNESEASANEENDSDLEMNATSSDSSVSTDSEANDEGGAPKKLRRKNVAVKRKLLQKPIRPQDIPSKEAVDKACQMREELLAKIKKLGEILPNNTLDQLIDELGGTNGVAEMTGRKMRLVETKSGAIEYQRRSERLGTVSQINLREKQRFMNDEKRIAIISEAASSGISLQSDRRVKNKRRRVHITLEIPWSADRAIQQFGRTHRSNQVNAPEYVFLISDLAGEHRFASVLAKRLESLGALTHADRRATDCRDLSRFHIDDRYGKLALKSVMKHIMFGEVVVANPPSNYPGNFRRDVAGGLVGVGLIVNSEDHPGTALPDKDYHNMSKFLNRILGMHVNLQNALFKFFTDTLASIIGNDKKQGHYDMGILDLGDSNAGKTHLATTRKFNRKHATGMGLIELHKILVDRGMSWEETEERSKQLTGDYEGYYLAKEAKWGTRVVAFVVGEDITEPAMKDKAKREKYYSVYRPNTGLQVRKETLRDITSKYTQTTSEKAKTHWVSQYESSGSNCVHAYYWSGRCRNIGSGQVCDIGRRIRTYFVLSGSVLLCWDEVEQVLSRQSSSSKIQIVRAEFEEGRKIVGLLIPAQCEKLLEERLLNAQRQEEEDAKEKLEKETHNKLEDSYEGSLMLEYWN